MYDENFLPNQVTGLVGWWDASYSTSVRLDPVSSGISDNNQPAGLWLNLAQNNFHLGQHSFAKKPTLLKGAGYRERHCIGFDGTDDSLSISGQIALTGDFSLWFVHSYNNPLSSHNTLFYGSGNNTELRQSPTQLYVKTNIGSGIILHNVINSTAHKITYIERNNNTLIYKPSGVDGIQLSTSLSGEVQFSTLGEALNYNFYGGSIGEIFIYNIRNSLSDQQTLEQYINRPFVGLTGVILIGVSFLSATPNILYSEKPRNDFITYIERRKEFEIRYFSL